MMDFIYARSDSLTKFEHGNGSIELYCYDLKNTGYGDGTYFGNGAGNSSDKINAKENYTVNFLDYPVFLLCY